MSISLNVNTQKNSEMLLTKNKINDIINLSLFVCNKVTNRENPSFLVFNFLWPFSFHWIIISSKKFLD